MPKEIAHGFIGCSALKKSSGFCSKILQDDKLKTAFLLGTISPDSGYYCLYPFNKGEEISEILHGTNGDNSYAVVKKLSINNPKILAFSLGYISHILLDAYWHPMIFLLTGDYYASNNIECKNARARHRRIELLIDSLITSHYNLDTKSYLIANYLATIGSDLNEIDINITRSLNICPTTFIKLWNSHSFLQKIFASKSNKSFFTFFGLKQELRALFIETKINFYETTKEIIEKHSNKTFEIWIEDSINQLANTFDEIDLQGLENYLTNNIGPSANTGKKNQAMYIGPYEINDFFLNGY